MNSRNQTITFPMLSYGTPKAMPVYAHCRVTFKFHTLPLPGLPSHPHPCKSTLRKSQRTRASVMITTWTNRTTVLGTSRSDSDNSVNLLLLAWQRRQLQSPWHGFWPSSQFATDGSEETPIKNPKLPSTRVPDREAWTESLISLENTAGTQTTAAPPL